MSIYLFLLGVFSLEYFRKHSEYLHDTEKNTQLFPIIPFVRSFAGIKVCHFILRK